MKVMQCLYSHKQNEQETTAASSLKQLEESVEKTYKLYLFLLLFVEEVGVYSRQMDDENKTGYLAPEAKNKSSWLLFNNPVIQLLLDHQGFHDELKKNKIYFPEDRDILRKVLLDLRNQETYQDYLKFNDENPMLNLDILLFVLKNYSGNFPLFQQILEENYFNWVDDKKVVIQMASKTLQSLAIGQLDTAIIPLGTKSDENIEFGFNLLSECIKHDDELNNIIQKRITKWEPGQVAMLDIIILKMAICEFIYFSSIPAVVTINEYIELAKSYSTPTSKKFINGVLDVVQKELKSKGTIIN